MTGMGPGTLAFNNFSGVGRAGTGTLKVDGKVVATKAMEKTLPMILQWDESFDIGSDTLTGVNDADYKPPFAFTGKLNKLTIKVDRPQLSPADIKKFQAAMSAASDGPVGRRSRLAAQDRNADRQASRLPQTGRREKARSGRTDRFRARMHEVRLADTIGK